MSFGVKIYRTLVDEYVIDEYEIALVHTSSDPVVTTASGDTPVPEQTEAVFWVGNPEHSTVIHALTVEEGYSVEPILGTQLIVVNPGDRDE